jgi:CHAT domain-containing protein
LLAAGASEFKGLAPLPLVPQELDRLSTTGVADQHLNQAFTPQVLLSQAADPRYDRVHVASHAEFLPGGPSKSVLHTGTGSMPLTDFLRLRQRRDGEPLELFSLSACRTALGDSATELGFAGLALQAGSRSAIGTLWYVDDVATSAYFLQLYRFLDQGMPKAEALQATRVAMIQRRLRLQGDQVLAADGTPLLVNLTAAQQRRVASGLNHPFFWGGIELIGSPW